MRISRSFPALLAVRIVAVLTILLGMLVPCLPAYAVVDPSNAKRLDLYDVGSAAFEVVPGTIKPVNGKYPDSMPLLLVKKECDPKTPDENLKGGLVLEDSNFIVTILAPGVTLIGIPTVTECEITAQINLASDQLSAGNFLINVTRKAIVGGSPQPAKFLGRGVLVALDASAGNIPGNASVDAYWSILSDKMCAKNFGRLVASTTYCIEVKIGNNSGYPLQLAGIGFKRQLKDGPTDINGNLAYRAVRGAAQDMAGEWTVATIINSATGLGILMSGFTPFFHAATNVARWSTGTNVVGTSLPKAISQVWHDPSQQQMNNLDDEAFRDNAIIANNGQIRTTVFLDRTLLDQSGGSYLAQACQEVYPPRNDFHTTGALLVKVYGSNPPPGVDQTPLDDPGRDAWKMPNADNRARCLNHLSNKFRSNDPNLIKRALGDLVIVGNLLSYMQRIVVDKNALNAANAAIERLNTVLSKPVPGADGKTITATVSEDVDVPQTIFAVDSQSKIQIKFSLSGPRDANGKVTYKIVDSAKQSLDPGTYSLVGSDNRQLTIPGDDLKMPAAQSPAAPAGGTPPVQQPQTPAQPAPNQPAPQVQTPNPQPK